MHGDPESARLLVQEVTYGLALGDAPEVVLCPPFVFLHQTNRFLEQLPVHLGAQSICEFENGAYTGEVSAEMVKKMGCSHVIVGHSERRQYWRECDEIVGQKTQVALQAGLIPIVCIGETMTERESGATKQVVERQLDTVLKTIGEAQASDILIAYEPVWAIGSGHAATPQQAQQVHGWIRAQMRAVDAQAAEQCRILYGGSVNSQNAASFMGLPDIDGCLVGGASLKAEEFVKICLAT